MSIYLYPLSLTDSPPLYVFSTGGGDYFRIAAWENHALALRWAQFPFIFASVSTVISRRNILLHQSSHNPHSFLTLAPVLWIRFLGRRSSISLTRDNITYTAASPPPHSVYPCMRPQHAIATSATFISSSAFLVEAPLRPVTGSFIPPIMAFVGETDTKRPI